MNNYCWYCGNKIQKNQSKCSKCDAEIFEKRVNIKEREILNEKQRKKENSLFIITIFIPLLAYFCIIIGLGVLTPLLLIWDLICLVQLRINYFYSTKVKVLTFLYYLVSLMFIIFIIWICVECGIIHPGY